jgi:hypothetical protein
MNQDIIDLHSRVPGKTPIVVTNGLGARVASYDPSGTPVDGGVPEDSTLLGRATRSWF